MPEYVCEVCDRTETMTEQEAFAAGWDYPPFMGVPGVISQRTCPTCPMTATAWWALVVEHTPPEKLSDRHRRAVDRILAEVA